MNPPRPEIGQVIRYAYLWSDEALAGAESGRKERPCVVLISVANPKTGREDVLAVPITHAVPRRDSTAIELPVDAKRQLGLDEEPSWIVTVEVNRFRWPGPDLVPVGRQSKEYLFGKLPMPLLRQVVAQLQANIRAGRLKVVKRTE